MPSGDSQTLRHLDYSGRAKAKDYSYHGGGGRSSFMRRERDRATHAAKLRGELLYAASEAERLRKLPELAEYEDEAGITLVIRSAPNHPLKLESLDSPDRGVILSSTKTEKVEMPDGGSAEVMLASVFVKHGKLTYLTQRVAEYEAMKMRADGVAIDNADLIANIESIGVAAIESFWNSKHSLPGLDEMAWWEVWVRVTKEAERERHVAAVKHEAASLGMEVKEDVLPLPEHAVMLVKTTRRILAVATALLNFVSELRRPAVTGAFFMELTPSEQYQFAEGLLTRLLPPPEDAPVVCVLDTGVNRGHPLLANLLDESDQDAAKAEWGKDDHYRNGHGTLMAGLAAYGDLAPLLEHSDPVELTHRIESVKILPRTGANDPELYGVITQIGMSKAENNSHEQRRRVFALAVTAADAPDFAEQGKPTAWSSAIDSHTSGALEDDDTKRLICISAGNVWLERKDQYPALNRLTSLEDPAQSWNALVVGAYTEKDIISDEHEKLVTELSPIAPRGGLSPHSATSCLWTKPDDRQWPIKHDVVFEGGNLAADADGTRTEHDSLCLLSTNADFQRHLFAPFCATSAATALAARMAAHLHAEYATLWPESVRGMIVHSAEWSPEMLKGVRRGNKGDIADVLRRFGFGVPDLRRALRSASSRATLFCQDLLQPFQKTKEGIKTKDMMLYRLPWPQELLRASHDVRVRLRVTLSYFIEPNPGSRAVSSKYRYAGCNLRFAVRTATERSVGNFIARVSAAVSNEEREAYVKPDDTTDGWTLGDDLRCRGSLHSDTWQGTASQLASMDHLIVYPVNGWWKLRTQHKRYNQPIRYSLIVSLETVGADLDIFTPIQAEVMSTPEVVV